MRPWQTEHRGFVVANARRRTGGAHTVAVPGEQISRVKRVNSYQGGTGARDGGGREQPSFEESVAEPGEWRWRRTGQPAAPSPADTPVRVRARQAHSCDQQERQKNGPFLLNKGVHGPYPQKKNEGPYLFPKTD